MATPPLDSLGPPPFPFQPSAGPAMSGPAFSPAFKAVATLLVFGCAAWLLRLWMGGRLGSTMGPRAIWFLAGQAILLWTWWALVRSVITVDTRQLHQTWMWDKRMELRELAYGKLIRVRGLDWLIAPRLYVRTLPGKFAVFYAADARMVAEFERLVAELAAFRKLR